MSAINKDQEIKVAGIVHASAVSAATVSGFSAQIPCADNTALAVIEVAMIVSLGEVFGKKITKSMASAIAASQLGTIVGRGVSQLLVGWIPIAGNITNAVTAAGVIEALGWSVAEAFAAESIIYTKGV